MTARHPDVPNLICVGIIETFHNACEPSKRKAGGSELMADFI
jgi:hypothetical protein